MSKSVIFGSHKNRGDINIDKAIILELSKTHSISSGDLKSLVEKSVGHIISSITFSVHIKNMLQEGELEKNDTGRGQKVFYSITEGLKRQLRLNLHRLEPQHTLFRKIYERLFLYEFWGTPAFIISSEQDFDKLLQSEFNSTRDKLKWGRVSLDNNSVIVDELYRTYSNTKIGKKHQKDHNKEMHLYWKKRSQEIAFEEVEFVCQPIQDDIDSWIIKTEYWQINKADKHKKYDTTYRLELPGVAINEFLDNSIGPEKFKSEDVKKAVALLVKEGILKSCMNFRDEIRYKIAVLKNLLRL